jgi:hypothetical protein
MAGFGTKRSFNFLALLENVACHAAFSGKRIVSSATPQIRMAISPIVVGKIVAL